MMPLTPELCWRGCKAWEIVSHQGPFCITDQVSSDGCPDNHDGIVGERDVKDDHGTDGAPDQQFWKKGEGLDLFKGKEAQDEWDAVHHDCIEQPLRQVHAPMLRVRVHRW